MRMVDAGYQMNFTGQNRDIGKFFHLLFLVKSVLSECHGQNCAMCYTSYSICLTLLLVYLMKLWLFTKPQTSKQKLV